MMWVRPAPSNMWPSRSPAGTLENANTTGVPAAEPVPQRALIVSPSTLTATFAFWPFLAITEKVFVVGFLLTDAAAGPAATTTTAPNAAIDATMPRDPNIRLIPAPSTRHCRIPALCCPPAHSSRARGGIRPAPAVQLTGTQSDCARGRGVQTLLGDERSRLGSINP